MAGGCIVTDIVLVAVVAGSAVQWWLVGRWCGGNGAIRAHWTALASVVNTKQDINIQGRMEEENLQTLINSFIL